MSDRAIGLRHRAGVGLTEECDAVVIIVSEETGDVSFSYKGQLERKIPLEEFKKRLNHLLFEEPYDKENK